MMHQSIPTPPPHPPGQLQDNCLPCWSWGWGFSKFRAAWVQAFANPCGKHQNLMKEIELVRHDFEAAVFKEYCDRKDPFYTYKINNKRGNPDLPSFIFKTSTKEIQIALDMNRNVTHFLNGIFFFWRQTKKMQKFHHIKPPACTTLCSPCDFLFS